MKRLITYDIKSTNNYDELYALIEEMNGKKITESSYTIDSKLSLEDFKAKLKEVISSDDVMYIVSVNTENKLLIVKVN